MSGGGGTGFSANPVPPPPESRDERPLAEAIQETWMEGPVTVAWIAGDRLTVSLGERAFTLERVSG